VQANGNLNGVDLYNRGTGTVKVVANQVTASNNVTSGLYELNASLYLTRCVVSGNSMGVYNNTNSTTRTYSAGDNFIYNNATNIVGPTMTAAPPQ
jgi:hypothetical protein